MIAFSCRCGHAFSVADDLAGGLVQCPQCKRLNDVPRRGELASLDDEGIYKIDEAPVVQNDPHRVAELTTVFTRDHFDVEGNPIDVRGSFTAPGGPVPVESLGPLDSAPPKYDPMTGELIRDIEVKPQPILNTQAIPTAKRVVAPPTRIDGIDIPVPHEAWLIPGRLLLLPNLLVMGIILIAHVLAAAMMMAIVTFYWILIPFWLILNALILAHFANVVDETGPTSNTDLPAPLRNLDWSDDTFGSFTRMVVSGVVCFGPGLLLLVSGENVPPQIILPISGSLLLAGAVFFPAALLTTVTSGSLLNLRPDRLFAVAYVCGAEYVMVVGEFVLGGSLWLAGAIGVNLLAAGVVAGLSPTTMAYSAGPPAFMTWPVVWGALILGIYLMHLFGCHLGLLYRRHHAAFPWLFQRHINRQQQRAKGFPVGKPTKTAAAKPRREVPMTKSQ